MKAVLQTAEGKLVAEVDMPPFQILPEVVSWGIRTFVLAPFHGEHPPEYREVFHYMIPVMFEPLNAVPPCEFCGGSARTTSCDSCLGIPRGQ